MVNSAFLNIVCSMVIAATHVKIYTKSLKFCSKTTFRAKRKNSKLQETLYEEDTNHIIIYSGKTENNVSV